MSKVIGRIVFEMECLYHVDTIFRTAENAIGNHLMRRLTAEIMEDAINHAAKTTQAPSRIIMASSSHISILPMPQTATPKHLDLRKKLETLKLPKEKFLKLMKDTISPERPPKKLKKLYYQYQHSGSPV
jgi:hypothetical protein